MRSSQWSKSSFSEICRTRSILTSSRELTAFPRSSRVAFANVPSKRPREGSILACHSSSFAGVVNGLPIALTILFRSRIPCCISLNPPESIFLMTVKARDMSVDASTPLGPSNNVTKAIPIPPFNSCAVVLNIFSRIPPGSSRFPLSFRRCTVSSQDSRENAQIRVLHTAA